MSLSDFLKVKIVIFLPKQNIKTTCNFFFVPSFIRPSLSGIQIKAVDLKNLPPTHSRVREKREERRKRRLEKRARKRERQRGGETERQLEYC
jgi:hypothetical protein